MMNLGRKEKFSLGATLLAVFGSEAGMKMDVAESLAVMRTVDRLGWVKDDGKQLTSLSDDTLTASPNDKQRLDTTVTYLREVHYY